MSETREFATVCYDATECRHCGDIIEIEDCAHVVFFSDGSRRIYHSECYLFAILKD